MIFTTVKNKEVTTLKKIKTWFKFSVKRISYFATFFQNSLFSHFFPLKHNKYFIKRGSGFATLLRMYYKTIKHIPLFLPELFSCTENNGHTARALWGRTGNKSPGSEQSVS